MSNVHPLQGALPPELEPIWLAALDDAGIAPERAILRTFSGSSSPQGECAVYMRKGVRTDVDGLDEGLLDELNSKATGAVYAYRVLLWVDRGLEGAAALIRHELEHARQIDARREVAPLHKLAKHIVSLDPVNSGRLYQQIPAEADANAASGAWVRSYFGSARINRLIEEGHADAAALRPTAPPPNRTDLPERMVAFFVSIADLCRSFDNIALHLNGAWRGGREIWEQMIEAPGSGMSSAPR